MYSVLVVTSAGGPKCLRMCRSWWRNDVHWTPRSTSGGLEARQIRPHVAVATPQKSLWHSNQDCRDMQDTDAWSAVERAV